MIPERVAFRIFFFSCLAMPCVASAQIGLFGKVDTVTSGAYDEFNPVLVSTASEQTGTNEVWGLFERRTATESQIVAKRYTAASGWDTTESVASSSPVTQIQTMPAYAELSFFRGNAERHVLRLAAWQRWSGSRWQIFSSMCNDSALSWSTPVSLLTDSMDNTDIRVQHIQDSVFIITWRRGHAVMGQFRYPAFGTSPETLAVSNQDTFSYDLSTTSNGQATLIWTASLNDTSVAVTRQITVSPPVTALPETLRTQTPCFNPHLFNGYYWGASYVYETAPEAPRQLAFNLGGISSGYVTSDPTADNCNGRAQLLPVITKPASTSRTAVFPLNLVVCDCARTGDSALVFQPMWGSNDTVRTPGHNRNGCIGSQMMFLGTGYYALAVWESNRSGRSHIYSRLVISGVTGIGPSPLTATEYALCQNYPNPCNPGTIITYVLPQRSHVVLSVYNTLGQLVTTLINAEEETGNHVVRFDGSNLSSGVYFYRLQAGSFQKTLKLVLVR